MNQEGVQYVGLSMIANPFLEFIFIVITSQVFVYQLYYFIRSKYQKIKNNGANYYYLDSYQIDFSEKNFLNTIFNICSLTKFELSDIDMENNIAILFKKPKIFLDFGFNFMIKYKADDLNKIELEIYCSNFDRLLYTKKNRLQNYNDLIKTFLLFKKFS